MTIKVCVGSSCHLKGSYDVIEKLKEVIDRYGVADKVELMASFCLGNCQNGVSATCDGELLSNLRPENVEEVFLRDVFPKRGGEKLWDSISNLSRAAAKTATAVCASAP